MPLFALQHLMVAFSAHPLNMEKTDLLNPCFRNHDGFDNVHQCNVDMDLNWRYAIAKMASNIKSEGISPYNVCPHLKKDEKLRNFILKIRDYVHWRTGGEKKAYQLSLTTSGEQYVGLNIFMAGGGTSVSQDVTIFVYGGLLEDGTEYFDCGVETCNSLTDEVSADIGGDEPFNIDLSTTFAFSITHSFVDKWENILGAAFSKQKTTSAFKGGGIGGAGISVAHDWFDGEYFSDDDTLPTKCRELGFIYNGARRGSLICPRMFTKIIPCDNSLCKIANAAASVVVGGVDVVLSPLRNGDSPYCICPYLWSSLYKGDTSKSFDKMEAEYRDSGKIQEQQFNDIGIQILGDLADAAGVSRDEFVERFYDGNVHRDKVFFGGFLGNPVDVEERYGPYSQDPYGSFNGWGVDLNIDISLGKGSFTFEPYVSMGVGKEFGISKCFAERDSDSTAGAICHYGAYYYDNSGKQKCYKKDDDVPSYSKVTPDAHVRRRELFIQAAAEWVGDKIEEGAESVEEWVTDYGEDAVQPAIQYLEGDMYQCPPGTNIMAGTCYECIPGIEWQNQEGQTSCNTCSRYNYASSRTTPCTNSCPENTFSFEYGLNYDSDETLKEYVKIIEDAGKTTFDASDVCFPCSAYFVDRVNVETVNNEKVCVKDCFKFKVSENGVCRTCNLGEYGENNVCKKCPPGRRGVSNVLEDRWQVTDTWDVEVGGDNQIGNHCTDCSVGKYNDVSGQTTCKYCPAGYYQNRVGQTSCIPCPAGYFQDQTGMTYCKPCSAGTFNRDIAQTECKPCPVFHLQNEQGQRSCKFYYHGILLSAGTLPVFHYLKEGSASISNTASCPHGTQAINTKIARAFHSEDASIKKWVNENIEVCNHCPMGRATQGVFDMNIDFPLYGKQDPVSKIRNISHFDEWYHEFISPPASINTPCKALKCPPGQSSVRGSASCFQCTIRPFVGISEKDFVPDKDVLHPFRCDEETGCTVKDSSNSLYRKLDRSIYRTVKNGNVKMATNMDPLHLMSDDTKEYWIWKMGSSGYLKLVEINGLVRKKYYTNKRLCVCPLGYYGYEPFCTPCEKGTYLNVWGSQHCVACPRSTYADEVASVECKSCAVGKEITTEGSTENVCTNCNAGTFRNESMPICDDCWQNSFSPPGQSVCTECSNGTYVNERGKVSQDDCQACGVGTTAMFVEGIDIFDENTKNCIDCPSNSYSTGSGCVPCSSGTFVGSNNDLIVTHLHESVEEKTVESGMGLVGAQVCEACPNGFSTRNTNHFWLHQTTEFNTALGAVDTPGIGDGTDLEIEGAYSRSGCIRCPAYTRSIRGICEECPKGYESNYMEGFFDSYIGACNKCTDKGMIDHDENPRTACRMCPPNTTFVNGSCLCNDGYFLHERYYIN